MSHSTREHYEPPVRAEHHYPPDKPAESHAPRPIYNVSEQYRKHAPPPPSYDRTVQPYSASATRSQQGQSTREQPYTSREPGTERTREPQSHGSSNHNTGAPQPPQRSRRTQNKSLGPDRDYTSNTGAPNNFSSSEKSPRSDQGHNYSSSGAPQKSHYNREYDAKTNGHDNHERSKSSYRDQDRAVSVSADKGNYRDQKRPPSARADKSSNRDQARPVSVHADQGNSRSQARPVSVHADQGNSRSQARPVSVHADQGNSRSQARPVNVHADQGNSRSQARPVSVHADQGNIRSQARPVSAHADQGNSRSQARPVSVHADKGNYRDDSRYSHMQNRKVETTRNSTTGDARPKYNSQSSHNNEHARESDKRSQIMTDGHKDRNIPQTKQGDSHSRSMTDISQQQQYKSSDHMNKAPSTSWAPRAQREDPGGNMYQSQQDLSASKALAKAKSQTDLSHHQSTVSLARISAEQPVTAQSANPVQHRYQRRKTHQNDRNSAGSVQSLNAVSLGQINPALLRSAVSLNPSAATNGGLAGQADLGLSSSRLSLASQRISRNPSMQSLVASNPSLYRTVSTFSLYEAGVAQPSSYLPVTIAGCILCCPIGVIGVLFSIMSRDALEVKDYQRAVRWGGIALWTGVAFIIGGLVLILTLGIILGLNLS